MSLINAHDLEVATEANILTAEDGELGHRRDAAYARLDVDAQAVYDLTSGMDEAYGNGVAATFQAGIAVGVLAEKIRQQRDKEEA